MKKRICLILCLMMCNINGYIYQAIVMRKWQSSYNRFHYFIGLGDLHDKKHPSNGDHIQQLDSLFSYAAQKNGLKLFTEDLSVANSDGRQIANGFIINSRGGILGGLTERCRSFGIDVDNLEYRYARVCALGPILKCSSKQISDALSTNRITIKDFTHEICDELDRLSLFQDDHRLNGWYQDCIQSIEKKMHALDWPAYQHASIADYVSHIDKPLVPFINHLLTFDASILDMKLVHSIMQHVDKERICAVAGGSHIERTSKVLQKIGYKSIFQTKQIYAVPSAVDAGSMIGKAKPQPIALEPLQKYF